MTFSKLSKLGLLIVVSIAILIWGLSFLKGNDIFRKSDEYHVIYDRIDGLSESNDVMLSGYKIGQVSKIRFLPDHSGRLMVSFMIDSQVKIPVNSVAQIVSSDLMGTRSIRINLSGESVYYMNNDTISGDVERDLREEVSMQVLPIKNKAEELLGTLDSAITVLTFIFNEDARQNLSESFQNINQTIYNLEKTTAGLHEMVATNKESIENILINLRHITTTFRTNSSDFEKTIQNLAAFSDTLAQISVSPVIHNVLLATEQLHAILSRFERTDNTAGLLLNDDDLYHSIELLADNLNLLTTDLRVNPERYLNFSAIDLGRKVYVNTGGDSSGNIIFKVHLFSSETQVPTDSELFSGLEPVEEFEASGAYTYLTGTSQSFSEILELHQKALRNFPDASIVAFRNGRLIKLERALRSLK